MQLARKRGAEIIIKIRGLLKDSGVAYIAVRRDVKEDGWTRRSTFQRNVILDEESLIDNSSFCIYKINKE